MRDHGCQSIKSGMPRHVPMMQWDKDLSCLAHADMRPHPKSAALAQLVEHIIRNDGVTGSSPVSGTISPSSVAPASSRPQGLGKLREKRSDEHTSELQSLMRTSYAVFC